MSECVNARQAMISQCIDSKLVAATALLQCGVLVANEAGYFFHRGREDKRKRLPLASALDPFLGVHWAGKIFIAIVSNLWCEKGAFSKRQDRKKACRSTAFSARGFGTNA